MNTKDVSLKSFWVCAMVEKSEPQGLSNGELRKKYAEQFREEVSRQTILEWIAKAYELFHIRLVCVKKRYHLVEGMGINASSDYYRQYLMNTFSLGITLMEYPELEKLIHFEPVPGGSHLYDAILSSMVNKVKLRFTYQSYDWDEPHQLTLPVYGMKQSQQRWYMICPIAADECHPYSLDRVLSLELTDEHFERPADFDVQQYYSTKFGIMNGDHDRRAFDVEAVVFGKSAKYVKSLPWHPSQEVVFDDEEFTVFRWHIEDSFDFRQQILSFGENVMVLKPQLLRNEINESLLNTCDEYRQKFEYRQKKRRE